MSHGDYKNFFRAACDGDVELVAHHLRAGVDVDFVHPELQSTALVAAIEERREGVALLLLDHGADPTLRSPLEGLTPLAAAESAGLDAVVARLRTAQLSRSAADPAEERVLLARSAEEQAEEEAFLAVYGPWDPLPPAAVARELDGFDRPWWFVGGWAVEAATGLRREHEDTDVSLLACDVAALVEYLRGRWHVWNNVGGVLHPLGERWPTVDEPASQLWLRRDATAPWVLDVPLTPDADGRWTNKRRPDHVADVDEVTWTDADGLRHLRPEIVVLYKATQRRPKDELDLDAVLPLLDDDRRAWLRESVALLDPEHPWLARI